MTVNVIDADRLGELIQSAGDGGRRSSLLVVDCRPFTAFNAGHIVGAVNVHCPSIVRRRAGGVIPVANIVRSTEALAALTSGRCSSVVVYDESSTRVDELDAESNARLSLNSLATVTSTTPLCLLRGRPDNNGSVSFEKVDHCHTIIIIVSSGGLRRIYI